MKPQLDQHDGHSVIVQEAAIEAFSKVDDTIRTAVRIPQDRAIDPEEFRLTCQISFEQIFSSPQPAAWRVSGRGGTGAWPQCQPGSPLDEGGDPRRWSQAAMLSLSACLARCGTSRPPLDEVCAAHQPKAGPHPLCVKCSTRLCAALGAVWGPVLLPPTPANS